MSKPLAILYSFRRCPYAIRARLALAYTGIAVELREVVLRNKPEQLLEISSKATVPVLLLFDGSVIDESLDIMHWALTQNDPDNWLNRQQDNSIQQLIKYNDGEFKYYLDRYKYADRYPEHDAVYYRQKAEQFLQQLENRLTQTPFLLADQTCLADMALFPFIRQFAYVDIDWFQSADYPRLNKWLNQHLESNLFQSVMKKYPAWQPEHDRLIFNP